MAVRKPFESKYNIGSEIRLIFGVKKKKKKNSPEFFFARFASHPPRREILFPRFLPLKYWATSYIMQYQKSINEVLWVLFAAFLGLKFLFHVFCIFSSFSK